MPKKTAVAKQHLYRFECGNLSYRCGLDYCDVKNCDCDTFYLVSTPQRCIEAVSKILFQKSCHITVMVGDVDAEDPLFQDVPTWELILKELGRETSKGKWEPLRAGIKQSTKDLGSILDEEINILTKFQMLTPVPEGDPVRDENYGLYL